MERRGGNPYTTEIPLQHLDTSVEIATIPAEGICVKYAE